MTNEQCMFGLNDCRDNNLMTMLLIALQEQVRRWKVHEKALETKDKNKRPKTKKPG